MSRKVTFEASVSADGKLLLDRADFANHVAKFAGKRLKVSLELDTDYIIDSHRGYYFAVVVKHCLIALRDVCGYDLDEKDKDDLEEIHDWLKKEFLNNEIERVGKNGEVMKIPSSTTRLDDEGWRTYLRRIHQFSAEMWGHEIPAKMAKYAFPDAEPIYSRMRREIQESYQS